MSTTQADHARKPSPASPAYRAGHGQATRFAPFAIVVVLLAVFVTLLALGIFDVLSAGRAYVAGESQWSRASRAAIFHLDRYAETGQPESLRQARRLLAVPLSDRLARLELLDEDPDLERARELLRAGRNHADDVPRMVRLFRLFRSLPYFAEALEIWRQGDTWILRLDALADELERQWAAASPSPEQLASVRAEIALIESSLGEMAMRFSAILGDGARFLTVAAIAFSVVAIALVALVVIGVFRWALRGIRASQQRFWNMFEHAPVGMALIDADARLVEVNDALGQFLERERSRLLDRALIELADPRDRAQLRELLERSETPRTRPLRLESRYRRPDGTLSWGKLSLAPLENGGARGSGLRVAVLENISEARNLSNELAYQAAHDQLTGLANRREFERALSAVLRELEQKPDRHALCLIDLDQFKTINDTFGHLAGDAVLVRLAEHIQHCLRDDDLLARLDGDEFGLIMRHCSIETAERVAGRLRDTIREFQLAWEDRSIRVSASLGLVEIRGDGHDAAALMQRADLATFEAKELGRNHVRVHRDTGESSIRRQQEMAWVHRIKEAISADRLRFHAQLIAPLRGDAWRCEMLVRLEDPEGRLHPAGSFIESAERFHVARMLDQWVVRHALDQIREHAARVERIRAWHINLSGQSVDCESVLPELLKCIDASAIDASLLCFEITESAAIHSLDEARRFFTALRQRGCSIALDDFGKGLSTFDYLKQLPVDLVKIDGGFVRELAHSELDHAMVRSIHEIARIAGMQTIAESVESKELVVRLGQIGIEYLQGHAIHNPVALARLAIPDEEPEPVEPAPD